MTPEKTTLDRIYLSDYQPPGFLITTTVLHFELSANNTRVRSQLSIRRRNSNQGSLRLDGEALELESIRVDGKELTPNQYTIDDHSLTVHDVPSQFTLQIENYISPAANTKLEGLYLSSGNFCTQCEPEGFRRITYFIDRPDVLSEYTVTLNASVTDCPVLLSNGNILSTETLPNGRHQITWHDPHPKPSYLFALVAGDLGFIEDRFTTASGRDVRLRIYAVERDLGQCRHALDALIQAMRWDELRYGREYDLDCFNIVAVEDFNMGAMENKSLNIFNTRYVLALPETATDQDYQAITGVIGHEYFHNWSGNRVTCRDWFQLSLKEGFTVFRDQEFSAELGSAGVKRIEDTKLVRGPQFLEDSGPMAHPVRPASYSEINNFYTLTVYIKGAEVVRMLANLLGPVLFRKGCDQYFDRHDGQAVTTEAFISAMEHTSGLDLSQFRLWYEQAGTPKLTTRGTYDAEMARYTLTVAQQCPSTPDQDQKKPLHIPLATALFDRAGQAMKTTIGAQGDPKHEHMLSLCQQEQQFVFEGVVKEPVVSLLRRFSAPVELESDLSGDELAILMAHDDDPFNRWDAGQRLFSTEVLRAFEASVEGNSFSLNERFAVAFENTLRHDFDDRSFQAYALALPDHTHLLQITPIIEPDRLHQARKTVKLILARRFTTEFEALYHRLEATGNDQTNCINSGQRALRNTCLSYLMALEQPEFTRLASHQLQAADNMTDALAALTLLACSPHPERTAALAHFFDRWQDYPLVMDKWFRVQATADLPGTLGHVKALTSHDLFQLENPNKVFSLLGAFAHANPLHFHQVDGQGYAFISEYILKLDHTNPQVAARLLSAFNLWRRYNRERQEMMREQLEQIQAQPALSKDVSEIINRILS